MVSAPTACASAKWLRGQTRRPETGLGAQLHLIALNCTSLRWGCRREAVSLAAPRAGDPPSGMPHVSRFTHHVSRFTHHLSVSNSRLRALDAQARTVAFTTAAPLAARATPDP